MILSVIKDLCWRNQFYEPSAERLDRDRYFMAQLLILIIATFADSLIFAIGTAGVWFVSVSWVFLLLLLTAHLLLAYRSAGKWMAFPLAIINLGTTLFIITLIHISANTSLVFNSDVFMIEFVLTLLWLTLHIFWFRKQPQLERYQPKHPLLKINPKHKSRDQLHAVGYFWQNLRLMMWNGALLIPFVIIIVVAKLDGRDVSLTSFDAGEIVFFLFWWLLVFFFASRLLYRRCLNIGWRFGKTLVLLILPFACSVLLKVIIPEHASFSNSQIQLIIWLQLLVSWAISAVIVLLMLKTTPQE
ncbi:MULTISPECIES: hypothetical protein [unclassified Vibrio]|nr:MULTISPECIES: hypothetical protein [unclassified Vibrio]NAW59943.1 hypothetical protein [Vibrio sp. V36_P2S2PM302]NAX25925.1 hypothetical protein [Vibrio sp. V38_P2S17PM301]NAX32737.1 hypothetical protein [Vibrio sp. V37_P2S8PM304]